MSAPDIPTLIALRERVRAANGADRELDRDIEIAFYPGLAEWPRTASGGWMSPRDGLIAPAREYTASFDAALGLLERVLPGSFITIMGEAAEWRASVNKFAAHGPTGALALISAILTALIDRAEHRDNLSDAVLYGVSALLGKRHD